MAKQFTGLLEQIASFENLYAAFKKAARGKRGQAEVAAFEQDLEPQLFALQDALRVGTWRPGGYRSFYVNDPKVRLVSAAPFADRVVHHALVRVIEPLFDRTFIADSYANRLGRGTHAALNRAQVWARHYRYVLQCDVRQFFPSVDHAVLMHILRRKLACAPTLALCQALLASGDGVLEDVYSPVYFAGDDLFAAERPRGLPIGNLTSQFWANVLLNELDQFVKRSLRWRPYLRYVDDFLLFGDDKAALWAAKEQVVEHLAAMRLELHARESTVYPCLGGIPFLGMRLFAHHRRLKARNPRAFSRRQRGWQRAVADGRMTLAEVGQRTAGWVAHARQAQTHRLRTVLLARPFRAPGPAAAA